VILGLLAVKAATEQAVSEQMCKQCLKCFLTVARML